MSPTEDGQSVPPTWKLLARRYWCRIGLIINGWITIGLSGGMGYVAGTGTAIAAWNANSSTLTASDFPIPYQTGGVSHWLLDNMPVCQ